MNYPQTQTTFENLVLQHDRQDLQKFTQNSYLRKWNVYISCDECQVTEIVFFF